MAITKRTIIQDIAVKADGQVIVYEVTEYWEGGFTNGILEATGPRTGHLIDVGDSITGEDQLVKDVINGNLHSATRKTARAAAKALENN